MNEELREKLGKFLKECYGVDINEAKFYFSTQNYAFIFPDKPYMIRVSMAPKKTRQEILSELMWVDDLKAFKQTICEPSTSLLGNILEECVIDGVTYRASMFRTARGNVRSVTDMDPMFFICVGELLGAVHEASADEGRIGMKYQRADSKDMVAELIEKAREVVPPAIYDRMREIEAEVNAIPRDGENFGLCHGDFHGNNFFVEANNVWLFDFDGCRYSYYLYDIASFVLDCLMKGYLAPKDARACLYEDIMPYFRIGYELHRKVDEHYYDKLEQLLSYRALIATANLLFIEKCGVSDQLEQVKEMFFGMLSSPDILSVLTAVREKMAAMEKK